MNKPNKSIYVSDEIYNRLSTLKHKGQSFNGLLEEMLDKLDHEKSKDKKETTQ